MARVRFARAADQGAVPGRAAIALNDQHTILGLTDAQIGTRSHVTQGIQGLVTTDYRVRVPSLDHIEFEQNFNSGLATELGERGWGVLRPRDIRKTIEKTLRGRSKDGTSD